VKRQAQSPYNGESESPAFSRGEHVNWKNRIVGTDEVDPADLLANPLNARMHPRTQEKAVVESLATVGWVSDVIVNRRTGFVVDGHLRVAAAISAEQDSVPVKYVDLTDEEEALILATYDATTNLAVVDTAILADLISDIDLSLTPTLEGVVGDLIGTTERAGAGSASPDADDDATDQHFTWGYAEWGETKVNCSGDDVGRLQALYDGWNVAEQGSFVTALIEGRVIADGESDPV